jgi:hypothetical protein
MKTEVELTYDDHVAAMLESSKRQPTYQPWMFWGRWGR